MLINTDNHCLRNYVGFLLVLALSVFCSLTKVTVTSALDETDKNQVKALDGIPEDLVIVYSSGATHARWGRSTYTISADGKVVYKKTWGSGGEGSREEKYYRLTKKELQLIIKKIKDSGFFSLNRYYSNPKIRDGKSSHISVTMDGKTHSVSVINTHQKEFNEIASLISYFIDKKKPKKPE